MKSVRQLLYFWMLNRSDQASTIRRLAESRMDETIIAEISGLDIEQVRGILAAAAKSVAA
jgi:hypothetical protein